MQHLQRCFVVLGVAVLSGGLALARPSYSTGDSHADQHKSTQKPAPKPPEKKPEPKPEQKPEPKPEKKPEQPKRAAIGDEVDGGLAFSGPEGKPHALKDDRGKIVAIAIWSTECPTCKQYEARMKKLEDDFASKGVVLLPVDPNASEAAQLKDFNARNPLGVPVLSDPGQKFVQHVGAHSTPEIYLLDAKGVLRYKGAIDDDPRGEKGDKAKAYVRSAIDELLAGKPVTTATTTATGSPIKLGADKKPDEKPAPPKKG